MAGWMQILVGAKGFEPSTPASRTRIKQGGLYALDYWSERAVNRTAAMVGHAVYRLKRIARHPALLMSVATCQPY